MAGIDTTLSFYSSLSSLSLCRVTPSPICLPISLSLPLSPQHLSSTRTSAHTSSRSSCTLLPILIRHQSLICIALAPSGYSIGFLFFSAKLARCAARGSSSETKLKDGQSAEVLGSLYFFRCQTFNRSGVEINLADSKISPHLFFFFFSLFLSSSLCLPASLSVCLSNMQLLCADGGDVLRI